MNMRRNTQEELIAMKKAVLESLIMRRMTRSDGAKLLKMHPNALSRLKARYEQYGEAVLVPRKTGPKHYQPPNRTSEHEVFLIRKLATERPDLGPIGIADLLFDAHSIKKDQTTVWRVLKREKIRYGKEYQRWKDDPKLYCLEKPGLELQLDGSYPFGRGRKLVCFDAIDDCSRWVYGKLYDRETIENGIDFVKHLIRNAPFRIERIRVDNRYGKKFVEFCQSVGIEVITNEPYCPQQNGKIERFHKTVKREFFWKYCGFYDSPEFIQLKLNQWLSYYNTKRRHSGYGMNRMTPQQKIAITLFESLNNINYPQKVTLTLQQYKY
jgi:transposase InsO family protein